MKSDQFLCILGEGSTHKSSFNPSLRGEKSIGFIRWSNLLLGFNFHFLNKVQPIAARPSTEATTMMAMRVVLLMPDFDEEDEADAADAVDEAEAVFETVLTRATEEVTTVLVDTGVAGARLMVVGALCTTVETIGAVDTATGEDATSGVDVLLVSTET